MLVIETGAQLAMRCFHTVTGEAYTSVRNTVYSLFLVTRMLVPTESKLAPQRRRYAQSEGILLRKQDLTVQPGTLASRRMPQLCSTMKR